MSLSGVRSPSKGPPEDSRIRPRLAWLLDQEVPERLSPHLSVLEGADLAISPVIREQLYLVLREAVRNVVLHSGAEEVRISIDVRGSKIVGMVEDDGGGFERVATEDRPKHGGLSYMIERAELHGGTCGVESVPGKGTRVMTSFPLSQP